MYAQRHQGEFWAVAQNKSTSSDQNALLDVLALLREVSADDAVSRRDIHGNILRTRTDVVRVLDPLNSSNSSEEDQAFRYFQVAHIGYVEKAEVDNVVGLVAHIVQVRDNFLWDWSHWMTIEWAYVGKRKAVRNDGEFPYDDPIYVDLRKQP